MNNPSVIPSARAKFHRAIQQFEGLKTELARFIESKPYRVVAERDPETDEWVIAQYPEGDFPDHWPLVLGEILYNLRCALDHAVYELTILNLGAEREGTEFPVFSDKGRFREKKKGTGEPLKVSGLYRIRGLTQKTQAVIEALQPFCVQNSVPGQLHTLALLNEMNNIDKHRTLHICRQYPAAYTWTPTKSMPFTDEVKVIIGADPNQRAELYRWPASKASPDEMGMEAEVRIEIAFDKSSAVGFTHSQPILLICDQLVRFVGTTLNQLEESVR